MTLLLLYAALVAFYFYLSLDSFFHYNRQCAQLSWLAFIFAFANILWEYTFPNHSFFCGESAVILACAGIFIFSGNENVWDNESVMPYYEKPEIDTYLFPVGALVGALASMNLFQNHWIGLGMSMACIMIPLYGGLVAGSSILMHHKYPKRRSASQC